MKQIHTVSSKYHIAVKFYIDENFRNNPCDMQLLHTDKTLFGSIFHTIITRFTLDSLSIEQMDQNKGFEWYMCQVNKRMFVRTIVNVICQEIEVLQQGDNIGDTTNT